MRARSRLDSPDHTPESNAARGATAASTSAVVAFATSVSFFPVAGAITSMRPPSRRPATPPMNSRPGGRAVVDAVVGFR